MNFGLRNGYLRNGPGTCESAYLYAPARCATWNLCDKCIFTHGGGGNCQRCVIPNPSYHFVNNCNKGFKPNPWYKVFFGCQCDCIPW